MPSSFAERTGVLLSSLLSVASSSSACVTTPTRFPRFALSERRTDRLRFVVCEQDA
eukprot:gene1359-7148_t